MHPARRELRRNLMPAPISRLHVSTDGITPASHQPISKHFSQLHTTTYRTMSFIETHNLSFHAIPVSLLLAAIPHWYAIRLHYLHRPKGAKRWDVSAPTEVIRNLKDAKLPPHIHDRFVRAEAAQNNGFTNVPLFCAAILAGNFAGLPKSYLNYSAVFYLISRALFNLAYINITKPRLGLIRSIIFNAGIIDLCIMFIKSGNKLM